MFTELGDTPLVIAMTRLWHGLLPSSVPHDDVDHLKACVLRGNYLNKEHRQWNQQFGPKVPYRHGWHGL